MTIEEIIAKQKKERTECLNRILLSKSKKKIIVAGAGTGKTYTFKEVLKADHTGKSIALTFIRKLTNEMDSAIGALAEVKTFHSFCKKILHEQKGKVELVAFLSKIIDEDSQYLELGLTDFDKKFQMLDENSPEVRFYLKRGDYYHAVSFNDSVYRLLKLMKANPEIVPKFNHILIDEFQDFNPLEVAFIDELEKRGKILIVGDDDQAVYEGRCASPKHLRDKFISGNYEIFELPFCSRCPLVIVRATKAFLKNAHEMRFLENRIDKKYKCYIEIKKYDSIRFPKIIVAQCSTGITVSKYVDKIITDIPAEDISDSWKEDCEYPTVLIAGPKQYLRIIQDKLGEKYPQMSYRASEDVGISIIEAYKLLISDINSNLGWRILLAFNSRPTEIQNVIKKSMGGVAIVQILDKKFVEEQKEIINIIQRLAKDENILNAVKKRLKELAGDFYDQLIEAFTPIIEPEVEEKDRTNPSILLTSLVGCKGLSAGHVIIVGANNGSLPKNPQQPTDVEIAQFIVALTRTRKQCHIISDNWLISPRGKDGEFIAEHDRSKFINWIPKELIEDKGHLTAKDIK